MKTILIDSPGLCHAAKHVMGDLTMEEKRVGVIFGFLNQILKLAKDLESHKLVFLWDSRYSLRKVIFPGYKSSRTNNKSDEDKKLDEIAFQQFDELRDKILPEIGFKNVFQKVGVEADDLIASIVSNRENEDFIIVSTDNDLLQILGPNTFLFSPRTKKLYTIEDFKFNYPGLHPKDWAVVKAIAGCKSDSIPGITGVGESTAVKYLQRKLLPKHTVYQKIMSLEGQEIINRNKKLTYLPFEGTPNLDIVPDQLVMDNLFEICTRLKFRSLISGDALKRWEKYLNIKWM